MLLHCARDPSFARISLHQHNVETETELGMVRVSSVVTAWALLPGSCQWYCETNYVSDHRNQRIETSGRSEKWASQCRQSAAALLVRSSGGLLLFPDNFARLVIIFICRHTTQHSTYNEARKSSFQGRVWQRDNQCQVQNPAHCAAFRGHLR